MMDGQQVYQLLICMLIQSHTSSIHFPFPVLSALAIVACLLVCGNSVMSGNIIRAQMTCNNEIALMKVPISKTKTGTLFSIKLYLDNTDTLPVAMKVYNNEDDYQNRQVNRYMLYENTGIDVDSIELGKPTQLLYYQTVPKQAYFVIGVHRLSYSSVQYATNTDRGIQSYFGSADPFLINMCLMTIKFSIQIVGLEYPMSNNNTVYMPPMLGPQCANAVYNPVSRACECQQHYGMQLCDTEFTPITDASKQVSKYIQSQQKHYYYYDSQASRGKQEALSILLMGQSNTPYKYSTVQRRSQFNVLYIIQPMSQPLRIPNIYNQMNPALINNLALQSGYRLVVAIYKPRWATGQTYHLQLSKRQLSFYQTAKMLVKIVVAVTITVAIIFIAYLCMSKQKDGGPIEGVPARPTGIPVRHMTRSKPNPDFFIQNCFPTVNFNQFHSLLTTIGYANLDNAYDGQSCSICLDSFETPQQQNIRVTYCCHMFHSRCLALWMRKQISCPNCRTQFTQHYVQTTEVSAGVHGIQLDPVDRYAKIWRYVKHIGNAKSNYTQCPTHENIQIHSQWKLPDP